MDPLTAISVASSVVGLLALGGKIISLLSKITSVNNAPDLARDVKAEMTDISAALRHIQEFLSGEMVVPFQRRHYILVEHVVATLTGCVTTYSELEAIVDNLGIGASVMRVYDRTKWALKENDIRGLLHQLQNHKSSLNLMLTILQCTSNQEIQQSIMRLCTLVQQVVMNNDNLSARLSRLEGSVSIAPDDTAEASINQGGNDSSDTTTIQPYCHTSYNEPNSGSEFFTIRFDFDKDLMVSRVYQRADSLPSDSHSESSITESTRRLAAFSIFSSQSLAEISNLSVYSLPICLGDISNSTWYIDTAARQLLTKNNEFVVFVKSLNGKTISIMVSPKETYEDLKRKIHDKEGLPVDWFCVGIAYKSTMKRIPDGTTLTEQGVKNESTLYLLPRARWTGHRTNGG